MRKSNHDEGIKGTQWLLVLIAIAACAGPAFAAGEGGTAKEGRPVPCALPRLAVPPTPARIPGYTESSTRQPACTSRAAYSRSRSRVTGWR